MPAMSSRDQYADAPEQFVLTRLFGAPPANAIAYGPLDTVLDVKRRADDRAQVSLLRRDLAELKGNASTLHEFIRAQTARADALAQREEELSQRENVVNDLMLRACALLDRVTSMVDDAERFGEEPAHPPGVADEEEHEAEPGGELTVKPANEEHHDEDGDEGPDVLPRAPVLAVTPPDEPEIGAYPKVAPDPAELET